jgi:hypothetical protein
MSLDAARPCQCVRREAVRERAKRAILIRFGEPLPGGEDPTVTWWSGWSEPTSRACGSPNTETDGWDPSDPEEHTQLLTTRADSKALRVARPRLRVPCRHRQ